ncbi:hypothetical protein LguiA_033197 [Lonicera macranthoides]
MTRLSPVTVTSDRNSQGNMDIDARSFLNPTNRGGGEPEKRTGKIALPIWVPMNIFKFRSFSIISL